MANLFDTFTRTDGRLKRPGEPSFPYLNVSSRPYMAALRDILEGWYSDYPHGQDKTELRERFRSDDDTQHNGAVFELFIHALLLAMGFEVEIHPNLLNGSSRHPDFRVWQGGQPQFYVECTLANLSDFASRSEQGVNQILESLEKLESPNFFLSPSIEHLSKTPPRLAQIKKVLQDWLDRLDPDEAERAHLRGDALSSYVWSEDGWKIEFQAWPRKKERRGLPGQRVVGPRTEPLVTDADERLRIAVENKAGRYGKLDLPYVVAVNVLGDKFDEIDLMEALFGHEEVFAMESGPESTRVRMVGRKPDGAFYRPGGLFNRGVSAAFVCDHISPGLLRKSTVLVHHPQARQRLDPSLWPLPQLVPHPSEPRLVKIEGHTPGEVMGIADPWEAHADLM